MAVSALLDGEDPGCPAGELERHLAGCPTCRAWAHSAGQVTRRARLQATRVPDLTDSILDLLASPPGPATAGRAGAPGAGLAGAVRGVGVRARRGLAGTAGHIGHLIRRTRAGLARPHRILAVRAVLVALAAGQAATALGTLTDGMLAPAGAPHTAHELGAFNLAFAVTLGAAAWRPASARTCAPILATAAGVLLLATVPDLLAGRAALTAEAAHLALVVGAALVGVLAWAGQDLPPGGQPRVTDRPGGQSDHDGQSGQDGPTRLSPAA